MTGLLSILLTNPLLFAVTVTALLLSITIHEAAHAYVADKLGDSTARQLGRISLNPLAHLDPLGTLVLLIAGFGWGKAVPLNYQNFQNPKRDAALVSFAGPASNFLMAAVLILVYKLLTPTPLISALIYPTILYNVVLYEFKVEVTHASLYIIPHKG
ncbi:site-2 protease family protein [Patescibacteria group bacterium]|nr:site-2 protease family protein [Patescibacteria group bacterium]MBU1970217.1 site-2 protease family protein [Patescibacteria group bacterium]